MTTERDPDLDLGGWDCEGQTGFELDEPNPDDARDFAIDDHLLDHLPSRPIEDVETRGLT